MLYFIGQRIKREFLSQVWGQQMVLGDSGSRDWAPLFLQCMKWPRSRFAPSLRTSKPSVCFLISAAASWASIMPWPKSTWPRFLRSSTLRECAPLSAWARAVSGFDLASPRHLTCSSARTRPTEGPAGPERAGGLGKPSPSLWGKRYKGLRSCLCQTQSLVFSPVLDLPATLWFPFQTFTGWFPQNKSSFQCSLEWFGLWLSFEKLIFFLSWGTFGCLLLSAWPLSSKRASPQDVSLSLLQTHPAGLDCRRTKSL